MRGTTCCEQDASLAIIRRALRFERIVANADVATTTYSYDANGNLTQAGGWNYAWDYLNRMLASGYNNSTTTFAYDPSGARVLQTSTTSTTYYPSKFYSLTSTKAGSNTYATSTNYIWNGDTLLATIDQKLYNGAATGSPITRYIHPDHLGSTNAVTDQNGALVQLMDYYPYGATSVSTSSYPTNEKRQYIGQFSDAQTSLNYLNARYYDGSRGQFTSQDPMFLGEPKQQVLTDPQALNAYSYSEDNPIIKSDPTGKFFGIDDAIEIGAVIDLALEYGPAIIGGIGGGVNTYLSHQSNPSTPAPGLAQYTTGVAAGAASGYFTEGKLLKLATAGAFSAAGSLAQDKENKLPLSFGNAAFSFFSPTLGYGLFGALAGPSAIQELQAGTRGLSGFYGGNVVDIGVQQIRYEIASGVFGMGMDSAQRGITNSGTSQQSGAHSSTATQSSGSSGGGYGSPGSTYTNYVPANAFSACGTLCR